jgi:hypothetical protein
MMILASLQAEMTEIECKFGGQGGKKAAKATAEKDDQATGQGRHQT